jgi:hypothetical protein
MPIRPEFRHFYGHHWRTNIRPRILDRAGRRCELCRAPDRQVVIRYDELPGWWFDIKSGDAFRPDGSLAATVRGSEMPDTYRLVKIVITVAHLNHVAGDDRDENLKAMCQWCHLNYDKEHHHETRAHRKDSARPLLAAIELASELVQ